MKGKIVSTFKKWWVTVLVFALILPLVSCSKRRSETFLSNLGFTQCDYSPSGAPIGSFDIYVKRSENYQDTYEVYIVTVQADAPGDIVSIFVGNSSKAYQPMREQVVIYDQQTIFAGYLKDFELEQYNILHIVPYEPGQSYINQNPVKDVMCELPYPGDGSTEGWQ